VFLINGLVLGVYGNMPGFREYSGSVSCSA